MYKPKTYHKLTVLLLLSFCTVYSRAQTADTAFYKPGHNYYWLTGNLGLGRPFINGAADFDLLIKNRTLFTLYLSVSGDMHSKSDDYFEANELAVLIGQKVTNNKLGNFFFSVGPSLVFLTKREDVTGKNASGVFIYGVDKTITTIGLPLMVKYVISPLPVLGFTVGTGININPKFLLYNVSLGISIGKLRDVRAFAKTLQQ